MILRSLFAQIRKNFTIIFRNKMSFLLILLAPFIILFLVGNLFLSYDLTSLRLGYVVNEGTDAQVFIDQLNKQDGVTMFQFDDLNSCVENVKYGTIKSCLEFKPDDGRKIKLTFHADYSEMNLVYLIINFIVNKFDDETSTLRLEMIQDLFTQMQKMSDNVAANGPVIKEMNDNVMQLKLALNNISGELDSDISFDVSVVELNSFENQIYDSRKNLNEFKDINEQTYAENKESLNYFESSLSTLKNATVEQKTIADNLYISPYGYDCRGVNLTQALDEFLKTGDSAYVEQKYIYCGCYQQFEPTIINFSKGMGEIVDVYDTMIDNVEQSKVVSYDTYAKVDDVLDEQQNSLTQSEQSLNDARQKLHTIDKSVNSLNEDRKALKTQVDTIADSASASKRKLGEFDTSFSKITQELNKSLDVDPVSINNPVRFSIKSIYSPKNKFVYFFPMMFFMLLMFIAIIFSSTFMNNELKSTGRFRTLISPAMRFVIEAGNFLSLFLVMFIQSIILLLICTIIYGVDLSMQLPTLLFIVALGISVFIMLGMLIGYVIKKDELVVLTSIGSVVVLLFYSSVIKPIETIGATYHYVIVNNPFMICIETFRRTLFFNMSLSLLSSQIITLVLEFVVLVILYAIAVRFMKK